MRWRIWGSWLTLLLALGVVYGAKSGDTPDGVRGQYVHVLGLYPEDAHGHRGHKLTAEDDQPFSLRATCTACHDVNTISHGWHFDTADPNLLPGRSGEPWIYAEARLATQIPLSYRRWPGTWTPDQVGLDPNAFARYFGRHLPGGPTKGEPWFANCLICHLDHPRLAPGSVNGPADQARYGNFTAVATATCPEAKVDAGTGAVTYHAAAFDDNNDVFLNLTRDVPVRRCAYCHAQTSAGAPHATGEPSFMRDEDVHRVAGLTCVDCHRHGLDHRMSRGYEEESLDPRRAWTAELTCAGCHLDTGAAVPTAGRLGAPIPGHRGLPAIHFERLTCTVCHTGPWPAPVVGYVKTARAHALGSTYALKAADALPRIQFPVYVRQSDGRIAPGKVLWPAFWGVLRGQDVTPLPLDTVRAVVHRAIRRSQVPDSQGWPTIDDTDISEILNRLNDLDDVAGVPVYVCGGRLHRLDEQGTLVAEDHPAAGPCVWPAGHNVRPAAQALGVRGCRDCHDTENPFFFGRTPIDSPLVRDRDRVVTQGTWQGGDPRLRRLFGWSFRTRSWLKATLLGTAAVLSCVLLVFGARAVHALCQSLRGGYR